MSKRKVGRPKDIVCILCNKKVLKNQPRMIIPIDKPIYLNIIVHHDCLKKFDENSLKNAVIQHIQGFL